MRCLEGKRVLVVEDEFFIAADIACELVDAGAVVAGPYATCPEALRALAHGRIDAAVLDVRLRDGCVYPLAQHLSDRNVPFLFHTGYSQAALPEYFATVPRIEKPSLKGSLLSAVQNLLQ